MEAFRRYQEIAEQILGKQPVVSKEDTNGDGNEFDSDLNAPTKWNGWGKNIITFINKYFEYIYYLRFFGYSYSIE